MHKWILDIKKKITRLQSTTPKKLDNKKDPKRDMHGYPWKQGREREGMCWFSWENEERAILIEGAIMGIGRNLMLQNFPGIQKDDLS